MVSVTAHEKLDRENRRTYRRFDAERLLERAEYLPQVERLLIEQSLGQGVQIAALAALHRVTPNCLTHKLRRLRRRLADPFFVLATQFADRLPESLRPVARSYYGDGLTMLKCAARHHLTLHQLRLTLSNIREWLRLLQVEAQTMRFRASQADSDPDGY